MIYKDGTDEVIERRKAKLGITGDVYVFDGHFIENLEGHKRLYGDRSTATTIEEAYDERVAFEAEDAERRRKEAEEAAQQAADEQEDVENGEDE